MVDRVSTAVNQPKLSDEEQKTHDEKMIAVADKEVTKIVTDDVTLEQKKDDAGNDIPTRPDTIPEKFWDAEKGELNVDALLKSQKDGEVEVSRLTQTTKKEDKPDERFFNADGFDKEGFDKDGKDKEGNVAKAKTTVDQSVVTNATAEWAEKGELSTETYDALAGVGLSRDYVDSYINGQTAVVAQMETAIYGPFSNGKDGYEAAANWAAENLTEVEVKALDVQIQSTNPAIAAKGSEALAARFKAEGNYDPTLTVTGGGNQGVTGQYFKSSAEMQAAMADPRYKKDAAFRTEVAQKIDRAGKANVNLFN